MLTLPEINQVLVRYGRGELDMDAATAALREEPQRVDRERRQVDPQGPYAAGTLALALAAARTLPVLTYEQFRSLGVAMQIAARTKYEPPEDEDSQPGGDAYRHHATPMPPDAYLNPGAPVIPEAYRNPDPVRWPPQPGT